MPTTRLPFANSKRSQVWSAALAMIQASAPLKAGIARWIVPDGDVDAFAPIAETDLPCLSITPRAGPAQWSSESQHRTDLYLDIELIVPGTLATDLMDAWTAIEGSIMPNSDLLNATRTLGVRNVALTSPGFTPRPWGKDLEALAATGTITITLYVDT